MNGNKQITTEIRVKAILDEAKKDFNQFSESVNQLWENQTPPKSILRTLEKLKLQLASMQDIAQKDKVNIIDTNQLESDYNNFQKVLRNVGIEFKLFTDAQKKAMLGTEEAKNIEKQTEALKKYNQVLQKSEEIKEKRKPLLSEQRKNNKTIKTESDRKKAAETTKEGLSKNKPVPTKEIEAYIAKLEQQKKIEEDLVILEKNIQAEKLKGTSSKDGANNNLTRQIELQTELNAKLAAIDLKSGKAEYEAYTQAIEKTNQEIEEQEKIISDCNNKIEQAENSNKEIQKSLEKLPLPNTKNALNEFKTALKEAGIEGVDNAKTVDELREKINEFEQNALAKVESRLQTTTGDWQKLTDQMDKAGPQIEETNADLKEQNDILANQQAFASRIKQFLGLEGAVNIARSAFRNAFNTIKELDAAMTEMAVVTDLDVGDYWKQLPQHTKDANKLGVAIKDVYEAETLYYQQGLKTNEVTAMSTQTLKMARIAGLSAEDATNKMTAALRGFNMELNETSAQRVADVYSELAAITASDVDEISSAMSKTASIASNAGMEFETTAAFLSQIIETTRESAETAGTALKTVIARFQELKKSPSEIGEVDGEVVDANKIETALRSVGVALRDTNGQFRNLDEVFLELSSKWDGLDTNTQRYIATIAAGSRQQSRFIAMMSDYSRTQELVMAANTSAGASNAQFEKTMDSLEAKLNKLKNAWDSFTMDIMNSNVIKVGVDILTALLTTINKITDAFGNFSGAAKIGMLVSALYLGDKALTVFNTSLQKQKGIFGSLFSIGPAAIDKIKLTLGTLTKATQGTNAQLTKLHTLQANTVGSTSSLKAAKEKLAKAEKNYAAAQRLSTQQGQKGVIATKNLTLAERNLKQAKTELIFQEQQHVLISKQADAMQALGIAPIEAETLALKGLTAQKIKEAIASEMATGLSKEEAIQKVLTAYGIQEESKALTLNNLIRGNSILKFFQNIGLLILGKKSWKELTKSEIQNTVAKGASIPVTEGQTAANVGLTASLGPLLLGILAVTAAIAALVIVVGLIVKAYKNWKASQPEAQLAALEEKTQQAKEAAKEAKEEYDELKTAIEGYQSLLKTVDSLTEGTTAWKDAVSDLNENVMELITNFPKLAKFAKFENGQWVLNQDELDAYMEEEEQRVANANAAVHYNEANQVNSKKAVNDFERTTSLRNVYVDDNGKEYTVEEYNKEVNDAINQRRSMQIRIQTIGSDLNYAVGYKNFDALENLAALAKEGNEDAYNKAYEELYNQLNDEQKEELIRFNNDAQILFGIDQDAKKSKGLAFTQLGVSSQTENPLFNAIANSLTDSYDDIINDTKIETEQAKWKKGTLWGNGANTSTELKDLLKENNIASSGTETKDLALYLAHIGGADYSELSESELMEKLEVDSEEKIDDALAKLIQDQIAINALDTSLDALYEAVTGDKLLTQIFSGDVDIKTTDVRTEVNGKKLDDTTGAAVEAQITAIEEQQESIGKAFESIFKKNGTSIGLSYSQQEKLTGMYNLFKAELGDQLEDDFADSLIGMYESFSAAERKEWDDKYGTVNWGSSIEGYAAIKEMLNSGNENFVQFARTMLEDTKGKYSNASQLQEIYTSISEDAMSDLMKDGKITAEEIQGLVDDNKTFGMVLDNTGESVVAVADYFTNLATGVIDLKKANEQYYEQLKKDNYAKYLIDTFWIELEKRELSKSNVGAYKTAAMYQETEDLYNKGAYNDDALWEYFNEVLSNEKITEIIDKNNGNRVKAADEIMGIIGGMQNSYGAWTYASQQLQGVDIGENGEIKVDLSQFNDGVKGLQQQLREAGFGESVIGAMIAELDSYASEGNIYTKNGQITAYANEESRVVDLEQEEKEAYESTYDWFFVLNQDIEDTVRKREKLEKRYARLLKQEGATAKEFYGVYKEILTSLNNEITNQETLQTEALSQIRKLYNTEIKGTDLEQYVTFDEVTGKSTLQPKYYTDNLDDEERKKFDNTLTKLFDLENIIKDTEDAIEDATDALEQEKEEQDEAITDALEKIKEGIIKERQEQIDQLSKINDTVKEAQDSLINKIQQQIDEDRQARENEKTQKDITDKEARLAYLMRDSSGANAMEIAQLQKEIAEAKQDYSDILVDQSIQKLSDSSEGAAEQRERQIELMQEQLDIYQEGVDIWRDAVGILFKGVNDATWEDWIFENTWLNSEAAHYIKLAGGYETMNPNSKEEFINSIVNSLTLLKEAYKNGSFNDILGRRYASGGLADFTGPAWLDGSKTHPELVLNAQDTKNFIQLKDVLSDIMNSTPEKTGSSGDNYFDIDIQVESIQDDYDVEQLAEKIKGIIYEDSIYRNVNSINNIR